VLARCVIALPAFGRFMRAGGWPKICSRVAWAAGATAVAVGALIGLILVPGPMTFAQWDQSLTYLPGVVATGLLVTAAIWPWARAAAAAGHLDLSPRARTGERVLAVAAGSALSMMMNFFILWLAAVQSSAAMLITGLNGVAVISVTQTLQIRWALRRSGRHTRPAA
jgi:hypothetical protein